MRISAKVTPRASKEGVSVLEDGTWSIRVHAPAVEGAANKACVKLLSKVLGVVKSRVQLVQGERNRQKVFEISGITEQEAFQRLQHK